MPVIFGTESLLQLGSQTLSIFTAGSMIKIDISLLTSTPTVDMDEDGTLVVTLVFPIQSVDSFTTLPQTGHLIQRNRFTHTCFPLTVIQDCSLTYPVLLVLDNEIYFGPTPQQFPAQTKNNVIRVFILMKFLSLMRCTSASNTAAIDV